MEKYFKKFKGIFCLVMCLCIAITTFQVGVFAEGESSVSFEYAHILTKEEKEGNIYNNGDAFGYGILTGTVDQAINGALKMDDKCWIKGTQTNRGYDDSNSNDIVRSFDNITYTVRTGINDLNKQTHDLYYRIEIDKDLKINTSGHEVVSDSVNGDKRVYVIKKLINADLQASGQIDESFVLEVGNKHQGDIITPNITIYADENESNSIVVSGIQDVYVTSAPIYNIVLKKGNLNKQKNKYKFDRSHYANNAKDYPINDEDPNAHDVTGFIQVFGVALEIRKPGNTIKGVEMPDSSEDFTFDIDLSDYQVVLEDGTSQSASESGFTPLLYYAGVNNAGGAAVTGIPYSNYNAAGKLSDKSTVTWCDDSGTYTMVQEGTTIHVTVKNFKTDYENFPQKTPSGESYNNIADRLKEGVFSSYQFQVVYPYEKADGKTINDIFPTNKGTTNASVKVSNMNATSITKTTTTEETIPLGVENTDNVQTETFPMTQPGRRNHSIIYSNRNSQNWAQAYVTNSEQSDNDIAVVGTNDLAFTVTYTQNNVGAADDSKDIPLAIDQLVLFDRDAIELNGNVDSSDNGYKFSYLYARHKGGRLSVEQMKTEPLSAFEFTETPSKEGYDGVLVQYRGCYTKQNSTEMVQMTRFECNVKPNYDLSDKVYMITAVTNTWNANDLSDSEKDEVLHKYNKKTLNGITREQYSAWMKEKITSTSDATKFIKNREHSLNTIDNRDFFTVPDYEEGVYKVDTNSHQFSQTSADALYLVPYKVSIQKSGAQKNSDNKVINNYNIGQKQRYIDYEITSQINFADDVQIPDLKTTVYYEDVLPKGLTYIEGSAYLGGDYQSQFPNQGKVTNGTKITPEIINNDDGTTTLKWKVKNVSLRKSDLDQIHYSCKIGDESDPTNDVDDQDVLDNVIKIQTDEDKRPYSLENNNISSYPITVKKEKAFYLSKTGKRLLELEDTGDFTLLITNTSVAPINNLIAVDTMPQNGVNDIIMNGQYEISKVSINKKLLNNANDFELYFTTSEDYKGKKANQIDEIELKDPLKWTKATKKDVGDDVEFEGLEGLWPTAIVYKDEQLDMNTFAKINIQYKAIAAKGDHLANILSYTNGNGKLLDDSAEVDIVKRSLEGTIWFDKDKDGKIGDVKDETRFKNVKVTLYEKQSDGSYAPAKAYQEVVKKADGTYEIISHPTTIETDENGHYKFEGLPEGDFKVVFESGDGEDSTDISHYDVTDFNQGTDEESSKVKKNNVVKENDQLISGSILDIKMPSKEEIFSENKKSYNKPNQNLGLIIPTIIISGQKYWDDQNDQDGLRPKEIKINLYANGKLKETKTVTKKDDWKYTFEDLDKYNDNGLITYTISENKVDGYTTTIDGYNITNTHKVTKINVPVTKVWNDNDNNDQIRPEKVIVHLYANNKDTDKTLELSEDNQWNASFDDLNQYENGKEIVYTVIEDEVKGYQVGITGSQDTGYILTNTHGLDTVKIKGTKTWDDYNDQDKMRPSKITVRLFADGQEIALKEVTKNSKWIYDFGNLVKYKDGKEINYEVKEDVVEGYTTSIKGFDITNSYTPIPSKPSTDTPSKDNENPKNGQPTNGSQTPVVKGKTITTNKQKIKTGDDTHLILYVLFVVLSFMGILFLKKKTHN
ncbi:MAG: Cna B-type domain-containing protein [Bacillota bacterium]|nr:Cna B-type domain-containing protein [Bacillota bacterium]